MYKCSDIVCAVCWIQLDFYSVGCEFWLAMGKKCYFYTTENTTCHSIMMKRAHRTQIAKARNWLCTTMYTTMYTKIEERKMNLTWSHFIINGILYCKYLRCVLLSRCHFQDCLNIEKSTNHFEYIIYIHYTCIVYCYRYEMIKPFNRSRFLFIFYPILKMKIMIKLQFFVMANGESREIRWMSWKGDDRLTDRVHEYWQNKWW